MSKICTSLIFYSSIVICICNIDNFSNNNNNEERNETRKIDILIASSNVTNNDTFETQRTICRITSDKIIADAEATVTKVLTGACNARSMEEHFKNLESKITQQLNDIKQMLSRLITKNNLESDDNSVQSAFVLPDRIEDVHQQNHGYVIENAITLRQQEIERFNNTVNEIYDADGKSSWLFTYYWCVNDISEKLSKWKTGNSLRSPTFYILQSGYAIFMRFTPKYFPDGTVFVSLGLTRGARDSQLVWPFPLKLQIELLDHSSTSENRKSRLWDPATVCSSHFWGRPHADNPECVGLSTSRSSFTPANKYIVNNKIFIKLIVYL